MENTANKFIYGKLDINDPAKHIWNERYHTEVFVSLFQSTREIDE